MLIKTSLQEAHLYQRFELGQGQFVAGLFGKPQNWSLSQLYHKDAQTRAEYSQRLGRVLYDFQVGRALAPSPLDFTDQIIQPGELGVQVPAGSQIVYRNPEKPADGVPLAGGDAYVVSPSSCPVTLMVRGNKALALHTGRNCLIDKHKLEHGTRAPGRRHDSICHRALELLGRTSDVWVKVFWAVPPHLFKHPFDHPVHGEINKAMYRQITEQWDEDCAPRRNGSFFLDLPKLIAYQCMRWGVPEAQIDLTHAYQQTEHTWLDGTSGTPRNLVVLARRA